jgi:hypothetical protein
MSALVLLALSTINHQLSTAFAQGTAFTYQGRLYDGTNPANGNYDLRFAIYDALTLGTQQGSLLTNSPTAVSNGLFTVTLDFGNQFPGASRWLEIAVRTNNVPNFFTLSPRQAVTPAPYAITAGSVISGGLAAGAYGNAVTFNNANNSFSGSFSGNGANLANVNAATLGGLSAANFWKTAGNTGTSPGANFLGTADNQPLVIRANNLQAMQFAYSSNSVSGYSPNLIGGNSVNSIAAGVVGGTVGGGGGKGTNGVSSPNQVNADFGTIGGGSSNAISSLSAYAVIGGGWQNTASQGLATIGGGVQNTANNAYTTIAGGLQNTASGPGAIVGGGALNTASGLYSTVVGGTGNTASGNYAIAGGNGCTASGPDSAAFGTSSQASGTGSTAMGFSIANSIYSTAMGLSDATGPFCTAMGDLSGAGGYASTAMGTSYASGTNSTALGSASATNSYATAMGYQSLAGGFASTATGSSTAGGDYSTAMGASTATGNFSTALGFAVANGNQSVALGGSFFIQTEADGLDSFAAGTGALALHDYCFVWNDGTGGLPYTSSAPDQFLIHANGGVGIGLTNPAAALHVASSGNYMMPQAQITQQNSSDSCRLRLNVSGNNFWEMDVASGSSPQLQFWYGGASGPRLTVDTAGNVNATSFNPSSDRNLKEHFSAVSPREVLDKVAALPITRWNFKEDKASEHLGPMAQDFKAAFGLGTDDKHIGLVDEGGVALAAIQGLNQKLEQKEAEITELKQSVADLKQMVQLLAAEK